jgi:membrane protein implicated in regulation of membrane protease activity
MEFEAWHIWLIIAFICLIMEIFLPSFILFNFGVGAFIGSLAAGLGASVEIQIVLFSVGTLLSFVLIRPVVKRYGYKRSAHVATNVDAMPGKKARVVEPIDNLKNLGRVALDGDDWRARSLNDEIIEAGTIVEIVKIESITLFVKPL